MKQQFGQYIDFTKKYEKWKSRKGVWKKCETCHSTFYIRQSLSNKRFCSKRCSSIGMKKTIKKTCKNCKKRYEIRPSEDKWSTLRNCVNSFCSKDCMRELRRKKYLKKKNTKDKSLKKKLWIVFSKYIRTRDGGVCISCGSKKPISEMDAGHYIPKTAGLSIYFDERNVNCQCTHCNRYLHGNLSKYALALMDKYGDGILKELDKKRAETLKISSAKYVELIEYYTKKLTELNGL